MLKADTVADSVAVSRTKNCEVNVDSDYALRQPDPNLDFPEFVRYAKRRLRKPATDLTACDFRQN